MITHHLPAELLLQYATGSLGAADEVLAACHLTLCPACRDEVVSLEEVGGALLDEDVPHEVDVASLLAGVLDMLDDDPPVQPPQRVDSDGLLPSPLAHLVGDYSKLSWQKVFPGVEQVIVPVVTEGMPLRIFRLKAGMRVPDHSHQGAESSLVLAGGFTDDEGHFGPGDVCVRYEQVHRQQIDEGAPCIVLTLADHALVPHTLRGRLASWIRKI